MKNTRHLLLLLAILSIFSACKEKEDPVDLCQNGFLDPGENGIDCGGNCTPCTPNEPATIYLEYNGIPMTNFTKELTYDNSTWSLFIFNDSLEFQFNLGTNGNIGNYPMNPVGSHATKNGTSYMNASDGSYVISAHNTQTQKMSGFFQVNFSRIGFTDTLKITSGQFDYLPY